MMTAAIQQSRRASVEAFDHEVKTESDVKFEMIYACASRAEANGTLTPHPRWIRAFAMCGVRYRKEGRLAAAVAAESIAWSFVSWHSYGRRPSRLRLT
jgi:hypothetical protein